MSKYKSNCKITSMLVVFTLAVGWAVGWANFGGKIKNLMSTKTSTIQIQQSDQPEQMPINYITSAEFETDVNFLVPGTYSDASELLTNQVPIPNEPMVFPVPDVTSSTVVTPQVNDVNPKSVVPVVQKKTLTKITVNVDLNSGNSKNGKMVCGEKNDKPGYSDKGKGVHLDEDCCIDPDEKPDYRNCDYRNLNKRDAAAMVFAILNIPKKIGSKVEKHPYK